MEINVIAFGQIAEITGKNFVVQATDIASLWEAVVLKHPEIASKKYIIAVNKAVVSDNIVLNQNDVVALMPPYSGG